MCVLVRSETGNLHKSSQSSAITTVMVGYEISMIVSCTERYAITLLASVSIVAVKEPIIRGWRAIVLPAHLLRLSLKTETYG